MSASIDAVPSAFLGAEILPPSILDEALEEVKGQLLRRYMGSYGSALSVTNGVDLYAVEVEGFKRIHTITHTKPKDGESSRKKKSATHGHALEELESMRANREFAIAGSTHKAKTTDDLADLKKNDDLEYKHNLKKYAVTNNTKIDIVVYDDNGYSQKTIQAKNTKSTNCLLHDRYAYGPDSPDIILVPKGVARIDKNGKKISFKEMHEERLNKIIDKYPDEQRRALAAAILAKLKESESVSRCDTFNPNIAIAKQMGADVSMRVGENIAKAIMPEIAALTIHGVVWELKDAQAQPISMTPWDRMKRFFLILWDKISSAFGIRAKKELALEALNGGLAILKSTFRSFTKFFQTLGKGVNQVWESVYNYVTGKITSFSELIAIILKSIIAVSIGALALSFESFLQSMGIPSLIGGFIAAAFAGIAVVFANRGIDASIKSMLSLLSAAELAKVKRAEIEAFCAESLPKIIDGARELSEMTKQYYAERTTYFSKSFAEMERGITQGDAQLVLQSLQSVNSAFGSSIPWKSIAEFDELMLDEDRAFIL